MARKARKSDDNPNRHQNRRGVKTLTNEGEDGTRSVITPDTPLRAFTVSWKGPIADNLGNKCYPGDTAQLDEVTAKFFGKRGYLEVEVRFDTGDTKSAAEVQSEAKSDGERNKAQESNEPSADASGVGPASGDDTSSDDASSGDSDDEPKRRTRRKIT